MKENSTAAAERSKRAVFSDEDARWAASQATAVKTAQKAQTTRGEKNRRWRSICRSVASGIATTLLNARRGVNQNRSLSSGKIASKNRVILPHLLALQASDLSFSFLTKRAESFIIVIYQFAGL
ncbi:MAG: hypothetical protein KF681_17930 [Bdellovibrionaceae bacterium]|nr:hypothetical protein [Pseudobdellovibrionaceae bacterium]